MNFLNLTADEIHALLSEGSTVTVWTEDGEGRVTDTYPAGIHTIVCVEWLDGSGAGEVCDAQYRATVRQ